MSSNLAPRVRPKVGPNLGRQICVLNVASKLGPVSVHAFRVELAEGGLLWQVMHDRSSVTHNIGQDSANS